ncbi:MAG: OmpA family protein [Desulfobulbus sp.]|nr:OmpA family protein [Desulfobulbus sp.]
MNTKRKTLAALLSVVMVLAACGKKEESAPAANPPAAPAASSANNQPAPAAPVPATPAPAPAALADTSSAPAETGTNLLSFANGALVERASSNYGGGWDAYQMLVENPKLGWANRNGDKPPFEIVFSFPERVEIHSFRFSTASTESAQRSAKDVDIEISEDGKTFSPVMAVELQDRADHQAFKPDTPATGRYLRYVVRSNHGDDQYWEIMDARAFGVELTNTPMPNVTGTYQGSDYGKFHLLQEGAQLSGCYEYNDGIVQGGFDQHALNLTWREGHEEGQYSGGPAIMVLSRDLKNFKGFWRRTGNNSWNLNWDLKKISDEVGSCPHWKPQSAEGNLVAKSLATEGRVRLYGINFDTDSDRIRADAQPTLNELVAALKANAAWKIMIEGHTDATGGAEHNRDLSNRRAAAVKSALAAAGIDADRLDSKGFGADQPLATNDTAIGRSQNRRVEIQRQ